MGNINTSEEDIDKLRQQTKAYSPYAEELKDGEVTPERTAEYEKLADEEIAIRREEERIAYDEAAVIIGPRVPVEMTEEELKKRREQTKAYRQFLNKRASVHIGVQIAIGYNHAAAAVTGYARQQILDKYGDIIATARKELAELDELEAEYIVLADEEIENDRKEFHDFTIKRKADTILRDKDSAARDKKWETAFETPENDKWDATFQHIADSMGSEAFGNFIFGKLKEANYDNIWVYYRNIMNMLHKYDDDKDLENTDNRIAMRAALGNPDIDFFQTIFVQLPPKVTADLVLDMMFLEEIPNTFISIEDGKLK